MRSGVFEGTDPGPGGERVEGAFRGSEGGDWGFDWGLGPFFFTQLIGSSQGFQSGVPVREGGSEGLRGEF